MNCTLRYTATGSCIRKMGMNVATLKYLALAVLFVTTFVFTLLPLHLISTLRNTLDSNKRIRYGRVTDILNCFAGGVFLSTAFLDLMPQSSYAVHQVYPGLSFPLAEFSVTLGFFLAYCISHFVPSLRQCESKRNSLSSLERLEAQNPDMDKNTIKGSSLPQEESVRASLIKALQEDEIEYSDRFYSYLLWLSLSLHYISEGVAIGLQLDFNVLLQVLVSAIIHKIPVAFCTGLTLMQSDLNLKSVVHLNLLCSLMSPVGIMASVYFEAFFQKNSILVFLNAIMEGLSTGTFMFVVFEDIFPRELNKGGDRLWKLMAASIGLLLVCIAIFWETRCAQLW